MIYWTNVAASRRQSTLRTAEEEEEEDIWVEAFDLLPTSFTRLLLCKLVEDRARDMRVLCSADRAAVSVSHTRGLNKYKNSTSVPWDRTTNK